MAKRSSAQIIAGMRERGWSLGQMGRVLGRDSSLLSQVARGGKPGANLQRELAQLASRTSRVKDRAGYAKAHEKALAPARRKRAGGEEAAVRKGAVRLPEKNFTVRGGKIGVTLERRLKKAAKQGKLVSFKVRYRYIETYARDPEALAADEPYEMDFAEHGWGAQEILDFLDKEHFSDDPQGAFEALTSQNTRVAGKRGYVGYTLSTSTRKRGG